MYPHAIEGRVAHKRGLAVAALLALSASMLCFGLLAADADANKKPKAPKLNVMTRNVYLGADLGPALSSTDVNSAVDATGEIANQVDRTDFPKRAVALAAEILEKKPDLVGLQEVALWRTQPTSFAVLTEGPSATTVEYDFLQLLLGELNKSGNNYEAVVVKEEFDAEFPVNDDTSDNVTGVAGVDHNERLTMRDVILRRTDSKAKVSNPNSGTFSTLLRVNVAGVLALDVTRGWTAVDVSLKGTKPFRFVNTHLEAFDSTASNPTNTGQSLTRGNIRAAQATELVAAGGPANTSTPVILLGDINSDDDTVADDGDRNAYNALLAAGLSERSTNTPLSCCLNDPNLVNGSTADFDHQVDHVLSDTKKVKLVNSSVTGLAPVSGLWPSDHAGVDSILKMPPKKPKK